MKHKRSQRLATRRGSKEEGRSRFGGGLCRFGGRRYVRPVSLVLQGVEQFREAQCPVLEFQGDFDARIANEVDGAVLADQQSNSRSRPS